MSPRSAFAPAAPRRRGRPPKGARPPGAPTTKELILTAASEAFAERGFDGASLVDIAAAAGVTTGAVYSHFSGKPELLLTVVSSTLEAIDPRRRADNEVTPRYLHEWIDWILASEQSQLRSLIAEINHAALRDHEVRSLLMGYSAQYSKMIAEMVSTWQTNGQVSHCHRPSVVAQMFLSQASGLCSSSVLQPTATNTAGFRSVLHDQLDALLGATTKAVL